MSRRILKSVAAGIAAFVILMGLYATGAALYLRRELDKNTAELKAKFQSTNATPPPIEPPATDQPGFELRTSWTEKRIDLPIPFWMALAAASLLSVMAFFWMFRKMSGSP
jgi:hypothetical protein